MLALLLVAGIGLGQLQNRARRAGAQDAATAFVQSSFAAPAGKIREIARANGARWAEITDSAGLSHEIERLREVERAAGAYFDRLRYLESEVRRLEAVGGIQTAGRTPVAARIVGLNPYAHRITIGVGSSSGIEPGMPVLSGEGLLALVETVGKHDSQALLLTSAASKFGGTTTGPKPVAGLVRGYTPGRLLIELLQEGEVTPGQEVVTSGFSAAIPRGLLVGTVLEVSTDPGLGVRQAVLLPAARVGNALQVVVLK